jgi:hypothetical protein
VKHAIGTVAVILTAGAGLAWGLMHWTYSDGQRAGYVQEFSHRGWPCKTGEGDLAMTTLPGVIAERFRFTVSSNAFGGPGQYNCGEARNASLRTAQVGSQFVLRRYAVLRDRRSGHPVAAGGVGAQTGGGESNPIVGTVWLQRT